MVTQSKLIPIYKTNGDVAAYLLYPYIFSIQGEWIGWCTKDRSVYSIYGHFVGSLSDGPRIYRKREYTNDLRPQKTPPEAPEAIRPPAHTPLAPQMSEVPLNVIDVMEEAPELLPPIDYGDRKEDLD